MSQSFKIDGFRELEDALTDLRKEFDLSRATTKNVFKRAMTKAAASVQSSAKAHAPVRTGKLKESISISAKLSTRQKAAHRRESELELFIGASALPHAHLQEFGSARNPAQPFLRPAWDANKMNVLSDLKKFLWSEIEKTADRARRKAAKLLAAK